MNLLLLLCIAQVTVVSAAAAMVLYLVASTTRTASTSGGGGDGRVCDRCRLGTVCLPSAQLVATAARLDVGNSNRRPNAALKAIPVKKR